MEWLKKMLGEDNFKKLEENGSIAMLKTVFGDMEYVPNDPTKIIPKHVFNEKLEKIKLLETQNKEYKNQLSNVGNMVTDEEMKTKLVEQEATFKAQIKEMETNFNKTQEIQNKKFVLQNELVSQGCKYPDLLIDKINYDDVVVKDNKILNSDSVVLPLKDSYKTLFEVEVTGKPSPQGTPPPQGQPSSRDDLIKNYNEAEKSGDYAKMLQLDRQIKAFKK